MRRKPWTLSSWPLSTLPFLFFSFVFFYLREVRERIRIRIFQRSNDGYKNADAPLQNFVLK